MDRRHFLVGAGALALAPAARAAAALEAKAARTASDKVRLEWTGAQSVSILVSASPEARPSTMRAVARAAGAATEVPAAISPRPYFLVRAADGRVTRVAERLLPLEGGRNFRDLGGWRAADGRQVKWGKIYRSGVMAGLTLADLEYLKTLGVQTICDLRDPRERASEPNPFVKTPGPKVVATDYDMGGSLTAIAAMKTREEAIQGFAEAYVGFLDVLTPHYTDMFARLVADQGPLAFNCSAGKDRTGMAAALILSVLGVPRATVLEDYGLTELYTPPSYYAKLAQTGASNSVTTQQMQALSRLPPEVLRVIMGADPEVMRRALATVDKRFGGPEALVKARYGMTDAKIALLRKTYLA